jgi:NAD(P)-dependent dehydrogenase (short-subunit alcohol dehydrogenase family)
MLRRFWPRIRDWGGALGEVAHSEPLRRAQVSFGARWASESAFMVGLGAVAFRDGGVVAVGVVTGARMAAAAVLTREVRCTPCRLAAPAKPEDLARPAVFLASHDAAYIIGSFVTVDGGVLFQQRSPEFETFPVSTFPTVT